MVGGGATTKRKGTVVCGNGIPIAGIIPVGASSPRPNGLCHGLPGGEGAESDGAEARANGGKARTAENILVAIFHVDFVVDGIVEVGCWWGEWEWQGACLKRPWPVSFVNWRVFKNGILGQLQRNKATASPQNGDKAACGVTSGASDHQIAPVEQSRVCLGAARGSADASV